MSTNVLQLAGGIDWLAAHSSAPSSSCHTGRLHFPGPSAVGCDHVTASRPTGGGQRDAANVLVGFPILFPF